MSYSSQYYDMCNHISKKRGTVLQNTYFLRMHMVLRETAAGIRFVFSSGMGVDLRHGLILCGVRKGMNTRQ